MDTIKTVEVDSTLSSKSDSSDYNYTDFPQLVAEDYIETLHKQSLILHKLGLSATQADTQRTFTSNVVEQGLFSFRCVCCGDCSNHYENGFMLLH